MAANAAPIAFQSAERQTPVLELYTSEGCSSCPPAEAWLSGLKTKPELWSGFVPVSFHVAYWNQLGWNDKLSSEQFTSRQKDYAQVWSAKDIYTPEFVVNGKEWQFSGGSKGVPSATATKVGVLQVTSNDGKHWQVSFVPAENKAVNYDITAALLVSGIGFEVTAGENKGRHLDHDFAALSLVTRPLSGQGNGFQGGFDMADAPKGITGSLALAVWVTRRGQLEPLQATGGWLPSRN